MLKINYLVTKRFISLYLVIMYDCNICINVCAYAYHEYECKFLCIFIFMFSLLFGIDNYCVIIFISHTKV